MRKEELKLTLFAYDVFNYVENSAISIKKWVCQGFRIEDWPKKSQLHVHILVMANWKLKKILVVMSSNMKNFIKQLTSNTDVPFNEN